MALLYSNENFPLPVVEALRRLGHDVMTTQESGSAGVALSDEAVLSFAAEQQRIVVTLNRRHFIRLHEQGTVHAGIIACTFDPDFAGQARRIHGALQSPKSMVRQLVRVNRPPLA